MTTYSYWRGALLATLCAGPVFISPVFVIPSLRGDGSIGGLLILIGISALFGPVISFLPILFGGHVMAQWGSRNPRARHPALWGLVGAALAALISIGLDQIERADPRIWAFFAFTGTVCALLVRFGTHWDDETPSVPTNTHEGEVK